MSFFERPLKSVSTEELEKVIGEAISTRMGKKYEAHISSLNFDSTNTSGPD